MSYTPSLSYIVIITSPSHAPDQFTVPSSLVPDLRNIITDLPTRPFTNTAPTSEHTFCSLQPPVTVFSSPPTDAYLPPLLNDAPLSPPASPVLVHHQLSTPDHQTSTQAMITPHPLRPPYQDSTSQTSPIHSPIHSSTQTEPAHALTVHYLPLSHTDIRFLYAALLFATKPALTTLLAKMISYYSNPSLEKTFRLSLLAKIQGHPEFSLQLFTSFFDQPQSLTSPHFIQFSRSESSPFTTLTTISDNNVSFTIMPNNLLLLSYYSHSHCTQITLYPSHLHYFIDFITDSPLFSTPLNYKHLTSTAYLTLLIHSFISCFSPSHHPSSLRSTNYIDPSHIPLTEPARKTIITLSTTARALLQSYLRNQGLSNPPGPLSASHEVAPNFHIAYLWQTSLKADFYITYKSPTCTTPAHISLSNHDESSSSFYTGQNFALTKLPLPLEIRRLIASSTSGPSPKCFCHQPVSPERRFPTIALYLLPCSPLVTRPFPIMQTSTTLVHGILRISTIHSLSPTSDYPSSQSEYEHPLFLSFRHYNVPSGHRRQFISPFGLTTAPGLTNLISDLNRSPLSFNCSTEPFLHQSNF